MLDASQHRSSNAHERLNEASALRGRLVYLRAASLDDMGIFYRWRTDAATLHLWTMARRIPSLEEFEREYRGSFLSNMTFVVCTARGHQAVGFVQAYSMNLEHGWAFILINVDPKHQVTGAAPEAAFLLIKYLSESFPLRKLYAEVFEYNTASIRVLQHIGFREEGRFQEHAWYRD